MGVKEHRNHTNRGPLTGEKEILCWAEGGFHQGYDVPVRMNKHSRIRTQNEPQTQSESTLPRRHFKKNLNEGAFQSEKWSHGQRGKTSCEGAKKDGEKKNSMRRLNAQRILKTSQKKQHSYLGQYVVQEGDPRLLLGSLLVPCDNGFHSCDTLHTITPKDTWTGITSRKIQHSRMNQTWQQERPGILFP